MNDGQLGQIGSTMNDRNDGHPTTNYAVTIAGVERGSVPATGAPVLCIVVPGFRPGDPCPDLLTEQEAIRYLRLDTIDIDKPAETLRRYRDKDLLRATQVSKKLFYRRSELDQLLNKLSEQNRR